MTASINDSQNTGTCTHEDFLTLLFIGNSNYSQTIVLRVEYFLKMVKQNFSCIYSCCGLSKCPNVNDNLNIVI